MQTQFEIIYTVLNEMNTVIERKSQIFQFYLFFFASSIYYSAKLHQRVKLRKEKKKGKRKNWSTRGRRKERGKPRRKGTMEGNRSEGNNLAARARG